MSLSQFHQNKKRYYFKKDTKRTRRAFRVLGAAIFFSGILFAGYFFFPLISWQIYLAPAFASQTIAAPIPQTTIITQEDIQGLWMNTARSIRDLYDKNADNWIPATPYKEVRVATAISYYFVSIPKLNISDAVVSSVDTDLSQHLVNYPGTPVPPETGNAVVFGHSTLPQLYDPKNYRTIFANVHDLKVGDTFLISADHRSYTYKIFNISIVDAMDTSYMAQKTDSSYLTVVTCTPPGTTWKRLIIRSRIEKI